MKTQADPANPKTPDGHRRADEARDEQRHRDGWRRQDGTVDVRDIPEWDGRSEVGP